MKRKILFSLFALSAISIGLYPTIYFVIKRTFGLLATKEESLLIDTFWNVGFYTHIIFGGIALFIGWINFVECIRIKHIFIHKIIGRIYVASVLLSSLSGIYIGMFATGGIISSLGFISLGVIWFSTNLFALNAIRQGNIAQHQEWMIYNYSACFAAVMLRIWLPVLSITLGDFMLAYKLTAWLCWIPNLICAYFIVRTKVMVINNILYSKG